MDFGDIIKFAIPIIYILSRISGGKKNVKRKSKKNKKKTVYTRMNSNRKEINSNHKDIKNTENTTKHELKQDKYIENNNKEYMTYNNEIENNVDKDYNKTKKIDFKDNLTNNKKNIVMNNEISEVVQKKEIGSVDESKIDLEFSGENIIKGIIMSEVLSKPKSIDKQR